LETRHPALDFDNSSHATAAASVLECGSPLPLSIATNNTPSGIIDFTNALIMPLPDSYGGLTSTNRYYRARLAP